MHHYGEDAVKVEIVGNTFNIMLRNHITGAEITVSGPLQGVFENRDQKIGKDDVEALGREMAHLLRKVVK